MLPCASLKVRAGFDRGLASLPLFLFLYVLKENMAKIVGIFQKLLARRGAERLLFAAVRGVTHRAPALAASRLHPSDTRPIRVA